MISAASLLQRLSGNRVGSWELGVGSRELGVGESGVRSQELGVVFLNFEFRWADNLI